MTRKTQDRWMLAALAVAAVAVAAAVLHASDYLPLISNVPGPVAILYLAAFLGGIVGGTWLGMVLRDTTSPKVKR